MKIEVTKNIVSDLWPLYSSGEASEDSRRMVEAFLAEDTAFRVTLADAEKIQRGMPPIQLSPDAERRLIESAHERARMKMWLIGATIGFAGLIALIALAGALFMTFGR